MTLPILKQDFFILLMVATKHGPVSVSILIIIRAFKSHNEWIKYLKNLPIEIQKEGQQIKCKLDPTFSLANCQYIGIHYACGVIQARPRHHWPISISANVPKFYIRISINSLNVPYLSQHNLTCVCGTVSKAGLSPTKTILQIIRKVSL